MLFTVLFGFFFLDLGEKTHFSQFFRVILSAASYWKGNHTSFGLGTLRLGLHNWSKTQRYGWPHVLENVDVTSSGQCWGWYLQVHAICLGGEDELGQVTSTDIFWV